MKTRFPIIRRMQIGFGAVIAVLLVVGVIAYHGVIAATASARWAAHTHQVLEHLDRLSLATENAESGYRDYAFSGDSAFLKMPRANLPVADHERGVLHELMADNPSQQRRLGILDDLAQQMVRQGGTLAGASGPIAVQTAVNAILKGQIDPILGQFRAVTLDMKNEERGLLHVREGDSERSYRQTKVALVVGSCLALLIAGVCGWMVPRYYTERREAEGKLRRLDRLYAMVSGITTLGARVRDRADLFRNSCRIAVEHGEFEMAWIGVVDCDRTRIAPIAWAGLNEKSMAAINDLFAGSEGLLQGKTLAARVIREKTAVISNDVHNDERFILGQMHSKSGVRSIAVLPLIVGDNAIGVFVLYTTKLEYFDPAGIELLTELAGNVAFAVDHIERQERLDRFAYYDALTGLANRSLFLDRVTQYLHGAARDGHRLALIMIDLERFRKFNDSLGRAAGDALLQQVAQWLANNAGNVNLVARVDADHFVVVVPEVTYEHEVTQSLEKSITALLSHPFRLNDIEYRIAAKAGVALFPDDGTDADALFRNAEAALKKAKVSGDRYLFYAQKMTDTIAGSLGIENRLRQALENEEFVLHYQPKVNLTSGKLTGAEALIRWNDPRSGLVPPARFIPILEETGLIHEVGRWALRKAMQDYTRWCIAGLPAVRIAVNVSPLQLRNRGFVAEIEEAISIAPEAAAGLELEITESLIMEDVAHSIVSLLAIRALGVTIAIDDFGTGFSSLSHLAKLPVDTLKIDRSFIVDMISAADGVILVSVIVNLAHALKLNVVAEGVETEEQLRQLRILHCDEMQGYLFGKPVPAEIFEAKYLTQSALALKPFSRSVAV